MTFIVVCPKCALTKRIDNINEARNEFNKHLTHEGLTMNETLGC
jgi:hypothetical protein